MLAHPIYDDLRDAVDPDRHRYCMEDDRGQFWYDNGVPCDKITAWHRKS